MLNHTTMATNEEDLAAGSSSSSSSSNQYGFQEPTTTSEITFQEHSYSSFSSSSTDRKRGERYTHRHVRVYDLNPEEKKKRTQVLNNEASAIYRSKTKSKFQTLKEEEKRQIERNQQLLHKQQKLQREINVAKRYLQEEQPLDLSREGAKK